MKRRGLVCFDRVDPVASDLSLWKNDETGLGDLKTCAIFSGIEPDLHPLRDEVEPVHDHAPEPCFGSDDRSVHQNTFFEEGTVLNRNIAADHGSPDIRLDDPVSLPDDEIV